MFQIREAAPFLSLCANVPYMETPWLDAVAGNEDPWRFLQNQLGQQPRQTTIHKNAPKTSLKESYGSKPTEATEKADQCFINALHILVAGDWDFNW